MRQGVFIQRSLRSALTLTELLVVLTILSVLTLVAVQATDGVIEQARFDATQATLTSIRAAVLGDRTLRNSDGTVRVTGFIADTGRPPQSIDELVTQPVNVIASTQASFDSDGDGTDDVTLVSGWNGPYVRFGLDAASQADGWGRNFAVTPVVNSTDPLVILSYGSNGATAPAETGYDTDLSVTMTAAERRETVTFRLFEIDSGTSSRIDPSPLTGTEKLRVFLYGPSVDTGTDGSIERKPLEIDPPTFETSQPLPIGRYAARGLRWSDTDNNDVVDTGEATGLKKSYVRYFQVIGDGGGERIEMELR